MSDEPVRLLDLPSASTEGSENALLRADLTVARDHAGVDYDVGRGLERFRGLITAGAPDPGTGSESPAGLETGSGAAPTLGAAGAAGIKTGLLWTGLAIGIIGAGIAASVVNETSPDLSPSSLAAPVGESASARPPPAVPEAAEATQAAETPRARRAGEVQAPAAGLDAIELPPQKQADALPHAPPASSIGAEMAHLAELRSIAGSDPGRAVALADEGHARFPKGTFGQEREAIAISALAQLGRTQEAQQRGRDFLSRHPESPFAESIQKAAGL